MTVIEALQLVNVLIVPALVYLVRIDKGLARVTVLQDVQDKQLERFERRLEALESHQATA